MHDVILPTTIVWLIPADCIFCHRSHTVIHKNILDKYVRTVTKKYNMRESARQSL